LTDSHTHTHTHVYTNGRKIPHVAQKREVEGGTRKMKKRKERKKEKKAKRSFHFTLELQSKRQ